MDLEFIVFTKNCSVHSIIKFRVLSLKLAFFFQVYQPICDRVLLYLFQWQSTCVLLHSICWWFCRAREPESGLGGKAPLEMAWHRAALPRTDCSGLCPLSFLAFPRMKVLQPVQCLVILTIRKVCLLFQGNFLYFHLCPLPLSLSLGPLRRVWVCLLSSHRQIFIHYPLEPVFTRLDAQGFLSPSSYERCSNNLFFL